jgi:hypothetical protein
MKYYIYIDKTGKYFYEVDNNKDYVFTSFSLEDTKFVSKNHGRVKFPLWAIRDWGEYKVSKEEFYNQLLLTEL